MDEFDQKLWYLVLSISRNEDRDTQEEDIEKAIKHHEEVSQNKQSLSLSFEMPEIGISYFD